MARKEEYEATQYPGIKRRISDNKYLVVVDLGRVPETDKKTGLTVMKQHKTQRIFETLKEAKAYKGETDKAKGENKRLKETGKVTFKEAIADYDVKYGPTWGKAYTAMKKNQEKRMIDYFEALAASNKKKKYVKDIDTLDIEDFFEWCRQQSGKYGPLCNNTIEKYKSHLNDLWKFMKKGKKYGVTENVASDADVGEVKDFEATVLTIEQTKYLLWYVTHCEKDYASFSLLAIPALAGLRRGELCGLRWKDIDFEKKVIDVAQQRAQIGSETVIKVPKMGDDNGTTRFEKRQRYAALPDTLAYLLHKVYEQQSEFLGKAPSPEDYVYRAKYNLVRGDLPRPGKVSKRFVELQERCNAVRQIQELDPIPIIRLHDLRHTFISMCINGGVSPLAVSANCGHRTEDRHVSTTIKTYWHDNDDRTEIREFIDKTFTDVDMKIPDLSESVIDDIALKAALAK